MTDISKSHEYLQHNYAVPVTPPPGSRYTGIKRFIARCMAFFTHSQNEFNANVTRTFNELVVKNEEMMRVIIEIRNAHDITRQELSLLKSWMNAHEQEYETLERKISDIDRAVEQLRNDGTHYREILQNYGDVITSAQTAIRRNNEEILSLQKLYQGLTARQDDIVASCEGITNRIDDLVAASEGIVNRINGLDIRQDDLVAASEGIVGRIDGLDIRQDDLVAASEGIVGRIDGLDARQDDVVKQQEEHLKEVHSLESGLGQLAAQLDEIVSALDNTMRKVDSAYATAESAHAGVESLDYRNGELHETMMTIRDIAHHAMARLDTLTEEVRNNHIDTATRATQTTERIANAEKGFNEIHAALTRMTRYNTYLRNTLDDMLHTAVTSGKADKKKIQATKESAHALIRDTEYALFEDAFRGSTEDVQARCKVYIPFIKESPAVEELPVLDLGCGRGEFVALMEENGYTARGVDVNKAAVAFAREKGLSVTEADVFEELERCEPESLGGISAFHLVEHMPFTALLRLLRLCCTRLAPGGILMIETPNARSLRVAASEFYRDPTHIRPVHPHVLEYSIKNSALDYVDTLYLHPYDVKEQLITKNVSRGKKITENFSKLNDLVFGYRDVGVIARKP